ncbi:MAG: hypothetical protein IJ679_11085 [Lachnospiraceae bacterium]|nr:hypothetical protein [Lachnospiraceae bacterium]
MKFTYDAYRNLLSLLDFNGYKFADYHDWKEVSRCVILRHDIDNDISQALEFARLEADFGVNSTYFVLIRTDMYNAFSKSNMDMLKEMIRCGHSVGLHFDEMNYPDAIGNPEKVQNHILEEAGLLEKAIGHTVTCVSMHRPSQSVLNADLAVPGMVNSYGKTFFRAFKYLSDSRRHWREPVEEIVESGKYDRLHILTHAFWYREKEQDMHSVLEKFMNRANDERYQILRDNITNLDEVISEEDVKGYS